MSSKKARARLTHEGLLKKHGFVEVHGVKVGDLPTFGESKNLFSPKHLTIDPSEVTGAWKVLSQETITQEISNYPKSLHEALVYILGNKNAKRRRGRQSEQQQ